MIYELTYEQWQKIDTLCDKLSGETLDGGRRIRFWEEYFKTTYNLTFIEDYEIDNDYGSLQGEGKYITWFLLSI